MLLCRPPEKQLSFDLLHCHTQIRYYLKKKRFVWSDKILRYLRWWSSAQCHRCITTVFTKLCDNFTLAETWNAKQRYKHILIWLKIKECTFQNTTNTYFKMPLFMYTYLHLYTHFSLKTICAYKQQQLQMKNTLENFLQARRFVCTHGISRTQVNRNHIWEL